MPSRTIKKVFDLSQMTVIDEQVSSAEYSDMELVEFLEFLVRMAFHVYLDDAKDITEKLADLLRSILNLVNVTLIDSPATNKRSAEVDDEMAIQEFNRYMQAKSLGL